MRRDLGEPVELTFDIWVSLRNTFWCYDAWLMAWRFLGDITGNRHRDEIAGNIKDSHDT